MAGARAERKIALEAKRKEEERQMRERNDKLERERKARLEKKRKEKEAEEAAVAASWEKQRGSKTRWKLRRQSRTGNG